MLRDTLARGIEDVWRFVIAIALLAFFGTPFFLVGYLCGRP